jgi:hypothetical protein
MKHRPNHSWSLLNAVTDPHSIRTWLAIFLAIGVTYRLVRWLVGMPLWGDEVMYALSFPGRGAAEIFLPLKHDQVAPPAFILYSWITITQVSTNEFALRFLSMVSGIGAFLAFAALARRYLGACESLIAVAVMAVSYYTVRHGAEFKPYALDLLVSVLILALSLRLRDNPSTANRVLFSCLIPAAVLFSYPSLFISAASLSVLSLNTIRRREWGGVAFLVTTGAATLVVFLLVYWFIIAPHSASNSDLFDIWRTGFPPGGLLPNIAWLLEQSSGRMFAYPIGGKPYASILTFGLFLLGIVLLIRRRRRFLLTLLLLPFGFHLLASFLGVYPYGMSQRISQHLAPSIYLLMAVGVAGSRFGTSDAGHPKPIVLALLVICLLLGLGGITRTVYKPYKTEGVLQVRQFVESLIEIYRCNPVNVVNPESTTPVNFLWYLKTSGRARFDVAPVTLPDSTANPLCVVMFDPTRYPERKTTLDYTLDRLREFRTTVDEDLRTAYIYGGDRHPHYFRYHVLERKHP